MIRKVLMIAISAILTASCGASVESFYDKHKNDPNVTAVTVPKFMYPILGNLSPEMSEFASNVSDIRYINIPSSSSLQSQQINMEIDKVTKSGYSDIFRQNLKNDQKLISIKEQGEIR